MIDSLLAPGREVLYKRYHTGELVPATILGPSDDGDDFVRLKYSRNGRDYENPCAPLRAVQFHLRSPSPMSSTSSEETPQLTSRGRPTSVPSHSSLPPGWQQRRTPDGRVFYVNHTKRETQWEEPPPAYSSVRASQPPPRAKPAGRKAPPQPMPKQPTLTDFFKPTSTAAGGQCCPIKSVRPQGERLGWGCHFCPCQEKPQARGARSAFPHEAGPQQGHLLGKVLSGSLQRIVLCMGWVSRAQGCVTAGSQHCRAQRTLCPTNTTCSNRIFCVHNYSLDTGGGGVPCKPSSPGLFQGSLPLELCTPYQLPPHYVDPRPISLDEVFSCYAGYIEQRGLSPLTINAFVVVPFFVHPRHSFNNQQCGMACCMQNW